MIFDNKLVNHGRTHEFLFDFLCTKLAPPPPHATTKKGAR